MTKFNINEYVEIYNPSRSEYLPVRVLLNIDNTYKALLLQNSTEIKINGYHLETYGYKKIWITKNLLEEMNFKKDGFIYSLDEIIIFECVIGEFKDIENHPYYLYEYKSKFLGYAIFSNTQLDKFKNDYSKIDFNSTKHKILEKYLFTSSINDVFNYLIKYDSEKYNFEKFDKVLLKNK